jgi:hypothetical protein
VQLVEALKIALSIGRKNDIDIVSALLTPKIPCVFFTKLCSF